MQRRLVALWLRGRCWCCGWRRRGRNRRECHSQQPTAAASGLLSPTASGLLSPATSGSGLSAATRVRTTGARLSLGTPSSMGGRLRVPVANRTGLSLTAIGRADSSDASACYVDGHSGLTGRKRPEVAETAERVKPAERV
jgi:hypothetical protein